MIAFDFPTPIPFIGSKIITKGEWNLQYPSRQMYYRLLDVDGNQLLIGNWLAPAEIVDNDWGPDSVITDALIEAAPWDQ
jgi:hypothetical protein